MKKNGLEDLTTEQLKAKIRILKGISIVMSSLVVMYLAYFIYKLSTGTWNTDNTLGTVALGMLLVVISVTIIQYNGAAKILQNRKEVK